MCSELWPKKFVPSFSNQCTGHLHRQACAHTAHIKKKGGGGHYYAWAGSAALMSMSQAFVRRKTWLGSMYKSHVRLLPTLLLITVLCPLASGTALRRGVSFISLALFLPFKLRRNVDFFQANSEHFSRWTSHRMECGHTWQQSLS